MYNSESELVAALSKQVTLSDTAVLSAVNPAINWSTDVPADANGVIVEGFAVTVDGSSVYTFELTVGSKTIKVNRQYENPETVFPLYAARDDVVSLVASKGGVGDPSTDAYIFCRWVY